MIGTVVLSVWTYFWSIAIAFKESGFIAAAITFVIPVLSQLYWAYRDYSENGYGSLFVTINLLMVLCIVLTTIFTHYSGKYASKQT